VAVATAPVDEFALHHRPVTDHELYQAVRALWGITIPAKQVCPNHTPPFKVFADAYFARHKVIVLKASRGLGGKSRMLATLGLTRQARDGVLALLGMSDTEIGRLRQAGHIGDTYIGA
jgi:hypothetical protein